MQSKTSLPRMQSDDTTRQGSRKDVPRCRYYGADGCSCHLCRLNLCVHVELPVQLRLHRRNACVTDLFRSSDPFDALQSAGTVISTLQQRFSASAVNRVSMDCIVTAVESTPCEEATIDSLPVSGWRFYAGLLSGLAGYMYKRLHQTSQHDTALLTAPNS